MDETALLFVAGVVIPVMLSCGAILALAITGNLKIHFQKK